jgi:hypothetical protein
MVGAGAEMFDKLEPYKNGPAPQHWVLGSLINPKIRQRFLKSTGNYLIRHKIGTGVFILTPLKITVNTTR